MMIIGDLNARIGKDEGRENRFAGKARKSEDETTNAKGLKLLELCDSHGFHILNGTSSSDSSGKYTFIGQQGCSVIDYCLVRGLWTSLVSDFEVLTQQFSDHMPVVAELSTSPTEREDTRTMQLPHKLMWKESNASEYQRKLDVNLQTIVQCDILDIENLIKISYAPKIPTYQSRYVSKEKWFDTECEAARKMSFGWLKVFRKFGDQFFKRMYCHTNTAFKQICMKKKKFFFENEAQKLVNCKNSKEFWCAIKKFNSRAPQISTQLDTRTLRNHFQSILNPQSSILPFHYAKPLIQNEILDAPITQEEICNVLKKLHDGKAPGADRIPVECFKYATRNFIVKIAEIFNAMLETANIPPQLKQALIYPIHKKGNIDDPANYRGISFLNSSYKIFTKLLMERMSIWIKNNNLIKEFQAGFRNGYSTVDNIFVLQNIAGTFLEQKKKLFAFFVDFKAAFDNVDRNALIFKLYNAGMSQKFGRVIENLYEDNQSSVWSGTEASEWFETNMGVRQGCTLSPYLFALYIDDLIDFLPGGIEIAGHLLKALLFADDVVLFAYSPESLQLMINRLDLYCRLWNLTVNLTKSKIMIFKKGAGRECRNEKWNLNGKSIEVVKTYKYLGVTIASNLSMEPHIKERLIKAKSAISATWKKCFSNQLINHSVKYKVFQAVAESIMMYAAQSWGYCKYDTVEKLLKYYIKRCFSLPSTTPNYMIYIETGLSPLHIKSLKLHVDYIVKVLDMPDDRLPKIIAKMVIERNTLWYKKLEELATYCGLEGDLAFGSERYRKDVLVNLIAKLDDQYRTDYLNMASSSIHRATYSILSHNLCEKNYFCNDNSSELISTIFRIRGELIRLNYIPHRPDLPIYCSLCNLSEREDVIHFIGKCPVLKEIRRYFLGTDTKSKEEVIDYLNCESEIKQLFYFYKSAIKYRSKIVTESF